MKQQQQPPIADPSREPLEEGEIDGGECVRGSLPVLLDCPRTEGKVKEKRVLQILVGMKLNSDTIR
jgi:hypothetical protein